jgi:hypothetical protein
MDIVKEMLEAETRALESGEIEKKYENLRGDDRSIWYVYNGDGFEKKEISSLARAFMRQSELNKLHMYPELLRVGTCVYEVTEIMSRLRDVNILTIERVTKGGQYRLDDGRLFSFVGLVWNGLEIGLTRRVWRAKYLLQEKRRMEDELAKINNLMSDGRWKRV